MTSGGTIPGLSLNLEAWIRNDGRPRTRSGRGMSDTSNDQAQDSPNVRDSPHYQSMGYVRPKIREKANYSILKEHLFKLTERL